jgi:hypothetical protein
MLPYIRLQTKPRSVVAIITQANDESTNGNTKFKARNIMKTMINLMA